MNVPKADYSVIAPAYDAARHLPDAGIRQWVGLITELGRLSPGSMCLDLGCGTGRFAIPLAESSGAYVVGADLCLAMLSRAMRKPAKGALAWVQADAQRLGLRSRQFQCVFASLILHHVDDVHSVLLECRRLLHPGGRLLIRTTAPDDMDTMPVYRFFPRAREIDQNRLPAVESLEQGMLGLGFTRIRSEKVIQPLVSSVSEYIDKVRRRNISALTLLSEEEYSGGFERMRQHFDSMDESEAFAEVRSEQMTLVSGQIEPR